MARLDGVCEAIKKLREVHGAIGHTDDYKYELINKALVWAEKVDTRYERGDGQPDMLHTVYRLSAPYDIAYFLLWEELGGEKRLYGLCEVTPVQGPIKWAAEPL